MLLQQWTSNFDCQLMNDDFAPHLGVPVESAVRQVVESSVREDEVMVRA